MFFSSFTRALARGRTVLAFLLPVAGLASCDLSTDPLPPSGYLKILNANPLAAFRNIDFGVNGSWILSTPYLPNELAAVRRIADPEEQTLQVRASGSTAVVASAPLQIGVDSSYAIFFVQDGLAGGKLIVKQDTATPPSIATNAKIQIALLAPGLPASVDIYFTPSTTNIQDVSPNFVNLARETFTPFFEFPAQSGVRYVMKITAAGSKTPLFTIEEDKMVQTANAVYTILVMDAANGGGPFQARFLYAY